MSLGLGIFLSTVVVSILFLYRWTRERWNWRKGIKWLAVWSITVCVVIGLSMLGYMRFENRLTKQSKYYDLTLGLTQDDVTYVKGFPNEVYSDLGSDFREIIPTAEIEKGRSIKYYDYWGYQVSEGERLDIDFDKNSRRVITIGCFSQGNGRCRSILGISTGSSEEDVLERFGEPDKKMAYGLTRNIVYTNLNLMIHLERKKVYGLSVGINLK